MIDKIKKPKGVDTAHWQLSSIVFAKLWDSVFLAPSVVADQNRYVKEELRRMKSSHNV
jgi:hypothetical protein